MIKELSTLKASGGTRTVYVVIFAMVLFSQISRVRSSRKFPLQFMSIYSNENIRNIVKLTQLRENNGVYSIQHKNPVSIIHVYRWWGDKTV